MAQLKNRFFGEMTGSFGDVVYRRRNGKNYTAKKPKSYAVPMDGKFQMRTAKFRLALKLAAVINSIPLIKTIWQQSLPKGATPYQKLVSLNYPLLGFNDVAGILELVPKGGFGARIDTSLLSNESLSVALLPLTAASMINPAVEVSIMLISLIFAKNPSLEGINAYEVLPVFSPVQPIDLVAQLSFTSLLSTADTDTLAQYQEKKIYNTLITFDASNNPVQYAKTFMSGAA
ncbi:MAG: hypothetical protein WC209_14565 [Ignavibacteriaceae bacterium]|jgi:hypothetical protein